MKSADLYQTFGLFSSSELVGGIGIVKSVVFTTVYGLVFMEFNCSFFSLLGFNSKEKITDKGILLVWSHSRK